MIICWDNIEKVRYNDKTGTFRVGSQTYYEYDACLKCGEPFVGQKNHDKYCSRSCASSDENNSMYGMHRFGDINPNYKGGYCSNNVPTYDNYAKQLEPIEQCRRNADDSNILEVKCTYCGKWYMPTMKEVCNRIIGIDKSDIGRFYCSIGCKQECPSFLKRKYYRGQEGYSSREAHPELRQLTFARDGHACQKCGSIEHLHCHHIEGIEKNPIESADMDICVTLCKQCHKMIHQQKGCGYYELRKCI